MITDKKPNAFVVGKKSNEKLGSVEEARAAMLAAGETPQGLLVSVTKEVAKNPVATVSVPATPQAAPTRADRKTYTQARLTLLNPDGTDGDTTLITAKTTFELNSLISRNNMLAQKNKKHIRVEFIDPNNPVEEGGASFAPEFIEKVVVPQEVPEEPVQTTVDDEATVEVVENAKFRGEIRQEDGEWIAEIVYKTGGGVERFTAPNRKALMLKVLEGKAHGTLRVREAIRREKYGVELDQAYTLPDYMTQEAFDALPEAAKQGIVDSVAMGEAMLLHKLHPEFYITEANSEKMQKFLNHKKLPYTVTNLTYAYEELAEADELETRPTPKITPSVFQTQTHAVDSAAAAPVVQVAPAPSAAPAPVPVVRKRGTTGLQPAQSSAASTELAPTAKEESAQPSELSEAELRKLPLDQLKARYKASVKPQGERRF
jgi:hypothetical protein